MCAYNRLNGNYCSQNTWLTEDVLRGQWHYDGLVVSDWLATADRLAGVIAGMDLEMPGGSRDNDRIIAAAVDSGNLSPEELDKVACRVTKLIIRAVEGAEQAKAKAISLEAHHQLAREAASKSAILLKNDNNLLPLKGGIKLAVIGEFAKKPRYQGSGSSLVNPAQLDNAWDALSDWALDNDVQLTYAPGYDAVNSEVAPALLEGAVALAQQADVVLIFAGLPNSYESEGFDRPHCNLPNQHNNLIAAIASINASTVVVLSNGASVTMPWLSKVSGVLESYLAGQAGGLAAVDLLTGAANPSGKLTETFALTQADHLSDTYFPGQPKQVEYREGLYVGYRYFNTVNKPVLFPFGFGLSYTTFEYGEMAVSHSSFKPADGDKLRVSGQVSNSGDRDGEEIVQVYVKALNSKIHRPDQVLAGFVKLSIAAGDCESFDICLDERSFSFYCVEEKRWKSESGDYEIQVGASSRDIRETALITVQGEEVQPSQSAAQHFFNLIKADHSTVPDEVFSSALGKAIPTPTDCRPFDRNSTLGDIQPTWLGRKLLQKVRNKMLSDMGERDDEKVRLLDNMLLGMPLRAMVLMSEDKLSFQQLQVLIHMLNGRYLKAIGQAFAGQ